jgi:predicted dehydrogenase
METVKIGVIGCGMISNIYIANIQQKFSMIGDIYGCADKQMERAQQQAKKFQIKAMTVEELLVDPKVEIILNLTIPTGHAEISRKALLSGKNVYSEKPLAVSVEDGRKLVLLAKQRGLYIGCAPDTFLGGGLQTVKKLLNDNLIGKPIFCNALMLSRGPESFHHHPEFLYQKGGGPLFDMGPYYVTAMVVLFGAIRRVAGFTKLTHSTRTIIGSIRHGEQFPCEVETHVSSLLEFKNNVIANLTLNWDMNFAYWESKLPLIEIFGEEGQIIVPDPNMFGGISLNPMEQNGDKVLVREGTGKFEEYPLEFGYIDNSRGIGLADMAYAIRYGKKQHASGELALHVLEVLTGILESSKENRFIEIHNDCTTPTPFDILGTEFAQ